MKLRLRGKIIIIFFFCGLIPSVIFIIIVALEFQKRYADQLITERFNLIDVTSQEVKHHFDELSIQTQLLSDTIAQDEMINDKQKLSNYIQKSQSLYNNEINDISIIDKSGSLLSSAQNSYGGDWITNKWFQQAVSSKTMVVSDVYSLPDSSNLNIAILNPIFNSNGGVIAVLVIQVPIRNLVKEIQQSQYLVEGSFIMIDENNKILLNDDTRFLLETIQFQTQKDFGGSKQTISYTNSEGVQMFGVLTAISTPNEASMLHWRIIIAEQRKLFEQKSNTLNLQIIGVTLVIFGLVFFSSFYFVERLTKKLNSIIVGAQKIAGGDLNYQIKVVSRDEVGQLATAFNKMSERLRELYKGLENKVQEKTKSLALKIEEINQKNKVQEDTTKAMLNVLEDLEGEKSKLENAKAKDEAILLALGQGLVVTDTSGKITLVNNAFESILGWKAKEALGKPLNQVVPMESSEGKRVTERERFRPLLLIPGRKVIPTGGTFITMTSDYFLICKDKKRIPVFISSTQMVLNNNIIGTVEVFRDITEEKEIDKAKSEFVSLASHQLRTPLTMIKWYTEMLLSGDGGPLQKEQKEFLKEVYDANSRMVTLVNALLNTSRLELGTFTVEPKLMDIRKNIQEVVKEMQIEIKRKKIIFKETYAENVPEINADPSLVHMIVDNLISNAIKYTPSGGNISVDVSVSKDTKYTKVSSQLGNIIIKISDTGYGIPKAQHSKIFTKLFRADNIKTKDVGGTGLGLYIVKSILDAVHGEVWFESEEGKGTTFYVALPLSGMKKKMGSRNLT